MMKNYLLILLLIAYVNLAKSEKGEKISLNPNEPDDIVNVLPAEETEEEEFEKLCGKKTIDMSQMGIRNLRRKNFENFQNIQCLNLAGNEISNISKEVFHSQNFENLLYLNLSRNSLDINKLDFINNHKNLKTLVLDTNSGNNNDKKILKPKFFLENLENLYLRNNNLTEINSWRKLLSENLRLKKLFLSDNKIKHSDYSIYNSALEYVQMEKNNLYSFVTVINLSNLTHLYFENGYGPNEICLFSNENSKLRVLSLKNCNLYDLGSVCLLTYPLKFLTTLDVSHNKLNRLSLTYDLLPSLKNLSLSHNPLYSVPENLAKFPDLKVLSLSYCNISEITSDTFEKFTNLQILSLRGNKITKLDFTLNLPNLRILDLAENQLQILPINWFANLNSLRYLNLNSNSFSSMDALNLENQLELKNLEDLHLRNNNIMSIRIVPLNLSSELTIHVGPIF
ncbi:chaoptin-like isoform X3 [Leptopilina heterotoma]|uniref:chaoptin-like isoform X2 n=1 Tax=Leptopilina heterotoma TaxID=63436 RepID=UPI001CA7C317|nr:chaoptin-like isoform X2 [Leptopilina heterotoma]XP_043483209.1 chaoptin-like isoform X3 [Leptopilina heterotoma]